MAEQTGAPVSEEAGDSRETKLFKDPIHGYIKIDSELVDHVIDTPAFQRLRNIRQTSYGPLFPGASHNRFTHSLGVYYLGHMAFSSIRSQLVDRSHSASLTGTVEDIQRVFELSCLLHDVGHAPFSHTGEGFFEEKTKTVLNKLLVDTVNEAAFTADYECIEKTKPPAPHERMSAIVGLRTFPDRFRSPEERSLFARCITGVSYRPPEPTGDKDKDKAAIRRVELLNCVVSLLNSSIIDVDRLDYIIRDAATIGFKNAQVDYTRLLKGLRIVNDQGKLRLGYHKSALSVIESAVFAHDAEKKWVQNHPAILYEMEILQSAMARLTERFRKEDDPTPIFCCQALTEEGKLLTCPGPEEGAPEDAVPVRLLADEDLLYLMKRYCKDELAGEFFARNRWRHAAWKSEAECRALFQANIGETSMATTRLVEAMGRLAKRGRELFGAPVVKSELLDYLDQEREKAIAGKDSMGKEDYADLINDLEEDRRWALALKSCADELKDTLEFDFLILLPGKFNSSFKADLGDIPIWFPDIVFNHGLAPLSISGVLHPDDSRKSNFFHIFYRDKSSAAENRERKQEIAGKLASVLCTEAIKLPRPAAV